MKKYLSIFAMIFTVHSYASAKPACPNVEAVKMAAVTDAAELAPGCWVAVSDGVFGTPFTWSMEIIVPDASDKGDAMRKGQTLIQEISGLTKIQPDEVDEDDDLCACSYLSGSTVVILSTDHI